jgi:uncharacterized membrane protein YcaP (DUF421 family)
MSELWQAIESGLGIGREDLNVLQMTLRVLVVYPIALAMVRLGDKRFLGELAALDFLLAIIIGSIVSRAISGSAPFLPSLVAGFSLVLLHRALAMAGFHFDRLGKLLKGSRQLMRNGELQWDEMRKAAVGEEDLVEAVRHAAGLPAIDQARDAYLERNGRISVIPRPSE